MLKKSLLASALTFLLVGNVFAQDEEAEEASGPWEITANGTLTSDYVFRGVSQSQEDPALQAGLNFEHESGFYTGIWGSSVDFTSESTPANQEDGANVEIDLFVGYAFDIADKWAADVQVVRYIYPGTDDIFDTDADAFVNVNYDYNEFIGSVSYNEMITASLGWSNDVFATEESGLWLNLSASHDLPWWGLSVNGEIGTYALDSYDFDGSDVNYLHYGLGLSKSFGPVTTSLGWSDTDNDGEDRFGEIAGSRVYFTVDLSTSL